MLLAPSHYAAEARYGYRLVAPYLPRSGRILDVGAGLCLLASRLRDEGYDVTALEPCASGFSGFLDARTGIRAAGVPLLEIGIEELDPQKHGTFDFIYSLNVLEHVADLPAALRTMARVLAPAGRMLHCCPNYAVPYENHFAIPLVPLCPRLTEGLLPEHIRSSELWRGLNFITYGRLRKLARECGLAAAFQRGTVFDSFARFDEDSEFAARQSAFKTIYRLLRASGLLHLTRFIPVRYATPMIAILTRT